MDGWRDMRTRTRPHAPHGPLPPQRDGLERLVRLGDVHDVDLAQRLRDAHVDVDRLGADEAGLRWRRLRPRGVQVRVGFGQEGHIVLVSGHGSGLLLLLLLSSSSQAAVDGEGGE